MGEAKVNATPDTLPANFQGWDNHSAPDTLPANFNGFDNAQPQATAPSPQGHGFSDFMNNPDFRFVKGVANNTVVPAAKMAGDAMQSPYKLYGDDIQPMVEAGKALFRQGTGEVSDAIKNPGNESLGSRFLTGGAGVLHTLGAMTPFGPAADAAGKQIASGDVAGGLGSAAGLVAGAVAPKVVGVPEANAAGEANAATHAFSSGVYTPDQLAGHTGVMARGTAMGRNYVPQDVAGDTLTALRQAAANNPKAVSTINGSDPVAAYKAYQQLHQEAIDPIEEIHQQAMSHIGGQSFDPSGLQSAAQSALPKSLQDFDPATAESIRNMSSRLGSIQTLHQLNDLRQYLGNQLGPEYRKAAVAAGRSGADVDAMDNVAGAARDAQYDAMTKAYPGIDFRQMKLQESSLLKAKEGLQNAQTGLTTAQALASQKMNPLQKFGYIVGAGKNIVSGVGGMAKGAAEVLLNQKPMSQLHSNMQMALTDLPSASDPHPYLGAPDAPFPKQLSASTVTNADDLPDDSYAGTVNGRPSGGQVTPPPVAPRGLLPHTSGEGLPQMSPEAEASSFAAALERQNAERSRPLPSTMAMPNRMIAAPDGTVQRQFAAPSAQDILRSIYKTKANQ